VPDAQVLNWPTVIDMIAKWSIEFPTTARVYGVPRGGSVVAGLLACEGIRVVDTAEEATHIIDDIEDSGRTRRTWEERYPDKAFMSLVGPTKRWVVFPWEGSVESDRADTITRMIQQIGDDPTRVGVEDTPERVARSWEELFSGYGPGPSLRWFEDDSDEMVVVRNIQFFSTCEHHMLPYFGSADVAYIPNGQVIGLSKIPRLVKHLARRMTIQERLSREIGETIAAGPGNNEAMPIGVAVHMTGQHLCMMARGVEETQAVAETNWLTGAFRNEDAARAEFMRGVK